MKSWIWLIELEGVMGKFKRCVCSDAIKEKTKGLLENLTVALVSGDITVIGKLLKDVMGSPYFIREEIFWQSFIEYLDNTCDDECDLRKLSEMLAEDGNSNENAKRLLKIIDDIETQRKAIYLSNLTRACCQHLIDKNKFFKLSQCIVRLTDEDLMFLCDNIDKKKISTDEEYIDDFRNCGLMKEVDGGFVYTKRAFELKKYSLWYGHDVEIPEIPERQIIAATSNEEIEKLFEEKTSWETF